MSKNKLYILIVDEDQSDSLPFDLQGIRFIKYSLYGNNKHFVDSLDQFLQDHNKGKKSELLIVK